MKRSAIFSLFSTPTRRRPKRSAYVIETLVPRVMLSADNAAAVTAGDSATPPTDVAVADSHDYPAEDSPAVEYPTTTPETVTSNASDEPPEAATTNTLIQPELSPMVRGLFDETRPNDLASLVDVATEDTIVIDADVPPTTQPSQSNIESTLTLPLISFIAEQVEALETPIESEFNRLDPLEQQQKEEPAVDNKPQTEVSDGPQSDRQAATSGADNEDEPRNATVESTSLNTAQLDELDQVFENSWLQFSLIALPTPPPHAATR